MKIRDKNPNKLRLKTKFLELFLYYKWTKRRKRKSLPKLIKIIRKPHLKQYLSPKWSHSSLTCLKQRMNQSLQQKIQLLSKKNLYFVKLHSLNNLYERFHKKYKLQNNRIIEQITRITSKLHNKLIQSSKLRSNKQLRRYQFLQLLRKSKHNNKKYPIFMQSMKLRILLKNSRKL